MKQCLFIYILCVFLMCIFVQFFYNKYKIMTNILIFTHFGVNIRNTFLKFVTLKDLKDLQNRKKQHDKEL